MKHPVIDYLLVSAACEINDRDNQRLLAEGRYIPWWKRHLLLTIALVFSAPVLLIGAFIVLVNVSSPSAKTMESFGTFLGWAIPLALAVGAICAFRRAEKRWHSNAGTTVVEVRRGP